MGGRRMAERTKDERGEYQIPNWERGSRFPKGEGVQVTPPTGSFGKAGFRFFQKESAKLSLPQKDKFLSGILHSTL